MFDFKEIKDNRQVSSVNPAALGLKINLYNRVEVEALAAVLKRNPAWRTAIECVMIGDSYFSTHLGMSSTALNTEKDRAWGLSVLAKQVKEVRKAIDENFEKDSRPFVTADLPDGSADTVEKAIISSDKMYQAGADIIKLESNTRKDAEIIRRLVSMGFEIMGHIGYTPQTAQLKRYGLSYEEALALFTQASILKEAGIKSLVLEMVSEAVNQSLCSPESNDDILIYSIFSGRAMFGGQSINVWDSHIMTEFKSKFFPPTAKYKRADYPGCYTVDQVSASLESLIALTLKRLFPVSPPSVEYIEELKEVNPWKVEAACVS